MSADDPLAKWRKSGQSPAPAPVREPERRDDPAGANYEAFKAADGALYLKLRRPGEPTQRPYYEGLINVIDDEPFGTNAVLVYSFGMVVMITGRNLSEMVEAIARHQVEWIQAFDPSRWSMPGDKATPVIDKIEIVVKSPVDGIADAERTGRKVKA